MSLPVSTSAVIAVRSSGELVIDRDAGQLAGTTCFSFHPILRASCFVAGISGLGDRAPGKPDDVLHPRSRAARGLHPDARRRASGGGSDSAVKSETVFCGDFGFMPQPDASSCADAIPEWA